MQYFTRHQIAAARGLTGWTQKELAAAAHVSPDLISKIEKGESGGSDKTKRAIFDAFDRNGVEFTDGEGVRRKDQVIKIYQGQNEFWKFFDDIYDVASSHDNPDICITNVDEAEYDRWLDDYEPIHNKRMTELGIRNFRVLVKEQDTHLTSTQYCEYRWTAAEQFSDVSLYLYGDKSAYISFQENDVVVTVVENAAVTDSMRKMFESVWDNSALNASGGIS